MSMGVTNRNGAPAHSDTSGRVVGSGTLQSSPKWDIDATTMRDNCNTRRSIDRIAPPVFPKQEVVARAIKAQYCQELKELWANLCPQ